MMMTTTDRDTWPPKISVTPMPMAVVMDLGRRVTYMAWSRRKTIASSRIQHRLAKTPARIPRPTALAFRRRRANCSYRGTARQTVAGVSR